MLSRIVQRMRRDSFETQQREARGDFPALGSFVADRAAAVNIPDLSKIPVVENNTRLQNDDGEFYFMFGYSSFGGPDILP